MRGRGAMGISLTLLALSLTVPAPALAAAPTISSIKPASGNPGTVVVITGTGFTSVTGVTFNGAPAATFTVTSTTKISATAPNGVSTGNVAVSTGGGTAQSPAPFTVLGPTVTLSAPSGPPTSSITVTGGGFAIGEAVDLYYDATEFTLVVTNSFGQIPARTLVIPKSSEPGQHWVTAVGRRSGAAAQTPFTVQTNWAMSGFNGKGTNANPFENLINQNNVADLDSAWSIHEADGIIGEPIVENGDVVVVTPSLVDARHVTNGASHWSVSTFGSGWATPAAYGSNHVVAGFNSTVLVGGGLHAVDLANLAGGWTQNFDFSTGENPTTPPVVTNGVVYVGTDEPAVRAYKITTGAPVFDRVLPFAGTPIGLAVANGTVYVGYGGRTQALDATTGALGAANNNPSAVNGPLTIFHNGLWVPRNDNPGGDEDFYPFPYNGDFGGVYSTSGGTGVTGQAAYRGHLIANMGSGSLACIGSVSVPTVALSNPSVDWPSGGGDVAWFVENAFLPTLEAYDPATCDLIWAGSLTSAGGGVEQPPVVSDGRVFAAAGTGLTEFEAPMPTPPMARPNAAKLQPTIRVR